MNKLPLPLLLLLAGCSFIPNYERPAAPVPADWPMQGAVSPAPTFSSDWRAYFTDPALQALIEAALAHNRDLRIAVARVEEARALSGLAEAERLPSIDLGLQEQAARVPGSLTPSGRPAINRRFDANLGITAFELDFWGRVKSLDAAARANFLASDYARQAFQLSLIAEVANAYYGLVELTLRARLAEATVKSRAESRALVAKRREVGLATDLDFLAADGAYQSARAELANLKRQQAAAENALRLLIGTEPAVPPAPTFNTLPEIAVGMPSEVLLKRPDVQAAEQKLIAANANIGAARAAFFPKIALSVLAGTASPALSGLFGSGSGAWSFVPVLKWPLFDAGRTDANEALAEARQHVAVAEYEKTIQQAFREVADLLAAREHYAEQLRALEAAEAAQAERLKRVEARQRAGVASYLELLDAQREHFAAQQAVIAVRRQLAATAAALFKATAGAG
ncbi:MAG: efflux transporter outer membrane subunit [Rhodocyclaceae bacterium]|nr:efflux transporter outer membrane subunit [Rhodocyclaceae bacterium]